MKILFCFILISTLLLQTTFAQNKYGKNRVVGYLPVYKANFPQSINTINLNTLTHLNIAFINPNNSGNIIAPSGLDVAVEAAHSKNVLVLASIAGGNPPTEVYRSIFQTQSTIENFAMQLVSFATINNLDGIDVDIEGNLINAIGISSDEYNLFIETLALGLKSKNKIITAALATWYGSTIQNKTLESFDFVNIMSYDEFGTWTAPGQHSSRQMATRDITYWTQRGINPNNIVLGVPFYGYGWGTYSGAWTYSDIIQDFNPNISIDSVGAGANIIYFNNAETILAKCELTEKSAGGIMVWELTQDATGENSLLKKIANYFDKLNSTEEDNENNYFTLNYSNSEYLSLIPKSSSENFNVYIYDSLDRLIYANSLKEVQLNINTNTFSNGLYFVKVSNINYNKVLKVLICN